jgi:hypothetical protein
MARLTMKTVNKAIQKVHPQIELVKGEGYFYIVGLDDLTKDKVGMLYNTSIPVYRLSHLSLEQWIESVTYLLKP